MTRRTTSKTRTLSRRSFVTMVTAGTAVLLARPALASEPARKRRGTTRPATAALGAATQKEFNRQRAGMLATLKTLREAPLPPGGDLPVVFKPRARKAAR